MDPCERTRIIRQGRKLEEEHEAHVKKAALLLDAESRWKNHLSKQEKRNRDNVIVALQSEKVPESLGWNWNGFERSRKDLRNDKEIMMLRLELASFETQYKNSVYKVPPVFRDDKEVMIKIVSKSSRSLIHASAELKNDRDVVLAAIQNEQPCAPLAIMDASKKLQGDKKIARVLLGHGHGIKALRLLPRSIQQDCNLVLQAIQWSCDECNESYETLSGLSEELLDDYDIVYEAVKRRGSNLQYVTDKSLLGDIDIVMAACENDGSAIKYVPKCPARDEMLEENNLIVLIENGGHCILEELGEEYIMDRKYLIVAVKNGMVVPEDISLKLYEQDRSLFKAVLRHSNKPFKQYDAFSESIREDANVGTDILKTNTCFDEGSWASRFSKEIPKDIVRNHIESLMKIAKRQSTTAYANDAIWDEKSIVVSLCKINGEYFGNVSTRLRSDVDVAKAAFNDGSVYIDTIKKKAPRTFYETNHDIAALAVKACQDTYSPYHVQTDLLHHMGNEVASCRQFFSAWTQRGWSTRNYSANGGLSSFRKDRAIALEAIKNAKSQGVVRELFTNFLPSRRLRDKDFMMKAVTANPLAFKEAGANLFEDFDYMLLGISATKAALLPFDHKQENFARFAKFGTKVRERISISDGFVSYFLGAMSIDPSGAKRANKRRRTGRKSDCHLCMLGGEGSESIKRTICQFADISVGPDLKMLRCALDNLSFWGY